MKQFQHVDRALRWGRSRDRTQAKQPLVPVYRVGELYLRGHRRWPQGTQFTYRPGGFELTLFRCDIEPEMVTDMLRGLAEFAIIVDHPLIVFAYQFGEFMSWDDVPYSWHLQPAGGREIPSLNCSRETRALLWVSLVGAQDGIVHAQRGMTLSPLFTLAIYQSIREQAMRVFHPENCTAAVSRLYLNYSSVTERLSLAAARTMGNE
jgi:hypothetical protein